MTAQTLSYRTDEGIVTATVDRADLQRMAMALQSDEFRYQALARAAGKRIDAQGQAQEYAEWADDIRATRAIVCRFLNPSIKDIRRYRIEKNGQPVPIG